MASAAVAVVSSIAAGSAGALATGTIASIVTGAVVGGLVSAAGAAVVGGDVKDALLSGVITGGIAGGIGNALSSSSGGISPSTSTGPTVETMPSISAATSTGPTIEAIPATQVTVPGVTGPSATAPGEPLTKPLTETSDLSLPGNSGSTVPNISDEALQTQKGGLLSKAMDAWGNLGDFSKATAISGVMRVGGGLLTGISKEKIAEAKQEAEDERLARVNNLKNIDLSKYTLPTFASKYSKA